MHSTNASRSLKKLFANYHEPAPLSNAQSQKLLSALKTSFRDQLDREYGRPVNSSPAKKAEQTMHQPEKTPIVRQSATNQHLKTLLANPLFTYKPQEPPLSPASSPVSLKRDPMDVFDHAVSKGLMTLKAATGCIMAKRQLILQLPDAESRRTASNDVALRVLRWLRSSHNDLRYLDQPHFVRALIPLLVAESPEGSPLEQVVWEWVSRTLDDASGGNGNDRRYQRASLILTELVKARSQPQNGDLDAAINTLLEAGKSFRKNPLLPKVMLMPWRSVSWLSTVESSGRATPSEKLYDAHVNAAHTFQTPVEVEIAHLQLHHPTHPDHTAAIRLIEDQQKLAGLWASAKDKHQANITTKQTDSLGAFQWIPALGHDTVDFLKGLGQFQEAQHIGSSLKSVLGPAYQEELTHT